jgi:Ser/Thr protein kinase RdoA (MazF antagonist)
MDNIALIKETFETQMGKKISSLHKFEHAPNNSVFKVEADSQSYIFKVYNKPDWPEDGKIPFVVRKLTENNIPHAQLFVFNREDDNFPNGYLIGEFLPGTTADRLALSYGDALRLFEKLAELVSRVHQINLTGYGYIGSGIAEWTTFSEHMYDVLNDNIPSIMETGFIPAAELESVSHALYERLKVCDVFPPVLNHGDLAIKNILVYRDEITLIDWDDAHSLCWMSDLARLTLWMKLHYDADTAAACRNAFLDRYETEYDKKAFLEIEDILHVWHELDHLAFFNQGPMCDSKREWPEGGNVGYE